MSTEPKYNLSLLRNALFNRAKLMWGWGLAAKLLVFAFGTAVIFAPASAKTVAITGIFLAVASELLLWLSDRWKSGAQNLHRKLDLEDSFGWKISASDTRDQFARYAGDVETLCGDQTGSYFASKEPAGTKRAAENLVESSWWSMHLSETMWWIFISTIVAIVVGCAFLLNVSLEDVSKLPAQAVASAQTQAATGEMAKPAVMQAVNVGVVKVVTSALLFIFSYGLFKYATGYFTFGARSKCIKEKAEQLLDSRAESEIAIIRLWQEYHLARDGAPLVPNWVWKVREKKLNALWRRTNHE